MSKIALNVKAPKSMIDELGSMAKDEFLEISSFIQSELSKFYARIQSGEEFLFTEYDRGEEAMDVIPVRINATLKKELKSLADSKKINFSDFIRQILNYIILKK